MARKWIISELDGSPVAVATTDDSESSTLETVEEIDGDTSRWRWPGSEPWFVIVRCDYRWVFVRGVVEVFDWFVEICGIDGRVESRCQTVVEIKLVSVKIVASFLKWNNVWIYIFFLLLVSYIFRKTDFQWNYYKWLSLPPDSQKYSCAPLYIFSKTYAYKNRLCQKKKKQLHSKHKFF